MLMIRTRIFLEIDISTRKKLLQSIKNIFISLRKFYVEFWLYQNSSLSRCYFQRVPNINGKTSLSINKTKNIFVMHISAQSGPFSR